MHLAQIQVPRAGRQRLEIDRLLCNLPGGLVRSSRVGWSGCICGNWVLQQHAPSSIRFGVSRLVQILMGCSLESVFQGSLGLVLALEKEQQQQQKKKTRRQVQEQRRAGTVSNSH